MGARGATAAAAAAPLLHYTSFAFIKKAWFQLGAVARCFSIGRHQLWQLLIDSTWSAGCFLGGRWER